MRAGSAAAGAGSAAIAHSAVRTKYPASEGLVALLEPRTNTSRRAIFQDDYVDALMTADRVAIACQAQLVNVIAPIRTRGGAELGQGGSDLHGWLGEDAHRFFRMSRCSRTWANSALRARFFASRSSRWDVASPS